MLITTADYIFIHIFFRENKFTVHVNCLPRPVFFVKIIEKKIRMSSTTILLSALSLSTL